MIGVVAKTVALSLSIENVGRDLCCVVDWIIGDLEAGAMQTRRRGDAPGGYSYAGCQLFWLFRYVDPSALTFPYPSSPVRLSSASEDFRYVKSDFANRLDVSCRKRGCATRRAPSPPPLDVVSAPIFARCAFQIYKRTVKRRLSVEACFNPRGISR